MACGLDAVGRMEPGKMTVLVKAAGTIIMGMARKQKGVSPEIIRSIGMLMEPRKAMRSQMKPMGKRNPSATKKYLRQRLVWKVRIISKKRTTTKASVTAAASLGASSGCMSTRENISIDQSRMGRVSSSARRTLRRGTRSELAMQESSQDD